MDFKIWGVKEFDELFKDFTIEDQIFFIQHQLFLNNMGNSNFLSHFYCFILYSINHYLLCIDLTFLRK